MSKIARRLAALGLAATMVGSLAACGGNSSDSQTADGGNNITIKFTWWGNQSRHDYTQKILDKYTELHPNVKFEAIPAGWDGYFDKLSTQAASGSMPDIVQMDYLYLMQTTIQLQIFSHMLTMEQSMCHRLQTM